MKDNRWKVMILAAALSVCSITAYAVSYEGPASASASAYGAAELEGMAVGDIVYIGDIAVQRAPDDDEGPSDTVSGSTTAGFRVHDFAGNGSFSQDLTLNAQYRYWYIWVNNTGSSTIYVTIGNDEAVQSRNCYNMPAGKYYIWSAAPWPAMTQKVGFTNGTGMQGSAAARLCKTQEEAEKHNG